MFWLSVNNTFMTWIPYIDFTTNALVKLGFNENDSVAVEFVF